MCGSPGDLGAGGGFLGDYAVMGSVDDVEVISVVVGMECLELEDVGMFCFLKIITNFKAKPICCRFIVENIL